MPTLSGVINVNRPCQMSIVTPDNELYRSTASGSQITAGLLVTFCCLEEKHHGAHYEVDRDPQISLALFAVVRVSWQIPGGAWVLGSATRVASQFKGARRRSPVLRIS